jgi:esterase
LTQRILHHERIVARAGSPERWLYVLHGIYGAGRNWAAIARRVTGERTGWGALLVDLREHGASRGMAPPHTLEAAAHDLERLAAEVGSPADAVLGHSFGGKVGLAYARRRPAGLRQIWLIDSTPEARAPAGSAWDMLATLRALPQRFASRAAFVERLETVGVEHGVAQWLATNLEPRDGEFAWRLDLDAMEALLLDFFETDLFAVLERPPPGMELHVVRASRSSVLAGEALARVERAATAGRVVLHEVEGGHWLNADNPDALVSLLTRTLPPD